MHIALQGKVVSSPWEGRWSNYEMRERMRALAAGEVAWLLPEGARPYWRGRVTRLDYAAAE